MKYVSYIRVSTQRQGQSGLGLEAQQASVQAFVQQRGGEVLAEFVEVESGTKADRPQLAAALAEAKRLGAVLLIAKVDRLARNVAFVSTLLESGTEVIACDMPNASRFEWHIRAAIGEEEARAISERTKAALQAAKVRGVALGWAQPQRDAEVHRAAVEKGAASTAAKADSFAERLRPVLQSFAAGASLRDIARELNERGILTPRGKQWQAASVRNVLARLA